MKDVIESLEMEEMKIHPFDTKMRYSIESSIKALKNLKKKKDYKARESEETILTGLKRMQQKDPLKFLYSFLEIVGARGSYKE